MVSVNAFQKYTIIYCVEVMMVVICGERRLWCLRGNLGMLVRFHFLIWALITCMRGLCGKTKL